MNMPTDKAIHIRNETEADYKTVEDIARAAFWNLYVPGCNEHYLTHTMRAHADFVRALDFVLELDGSVIGNIMYTKATLTDDGGAVKEILTFGPVCILPAYQRRGYGKLLMEHSFEKAAALGYDVIVIFGNPGNYVARGFKSCKKYNVCAGNGTFPTAMIVKELRPCALDGRRWVYRDSPAMTIDEDAAERFDAALPPLEKKELPCQEEFYILSNSTLQETQDD